MHNAIPSLAALITLAWLGTARTDARAATPQVTPAAGPVFGPIVALDTEAPDLAAARQAFAQAKRHYAKDRLEPALTAALAGWRAAPSARASRIVATIVIALDRPCEALRYLLDGLDRAPQGATRERRAVEKMLIDATAACHPALGWVTLRSSAPGAFVTLGSQVFRLPRSFAVPAGDRVVAVSAAGHVRHNKRLVIVAGKPHNVEVTLLKVPSLGLEIGQVLSPAYPPPSPGSGRIGERLSLTSGPAQVTRTSRLDPGSNGKVMGDALIGTGVGISVALTIASGAVLLDSLSMPLSAEAAAETNNWALGLWVGGFVVGGVLVAIGASSYESQATAVSVAPWVAPDTGGVAAMGQF